jgi:ribosomal protein L16 Arg81 hydroxylase
MYSGDIMQINFGLTKEQFEYEYDEKKPYLRKRALESVFTIFDLERILYLIDPATPFMKMRHGQEIEKSTYIEEVYRAGRPVTRLHRRKFNNLMDAGATLILNNIEIYSLDLKMLCNQVSRLIGQEVKANGYFTTGSESTFGFHWDPHDVFALQLFGCKKWTLYKPTIYSPIPRMVRNDSGPDMSEEAIEITLAPGDILYVPRGWWHNVQGTGAPTFHIALGVQILHYANYITWACRWLLREHSACRKKIRLDGGEPQDLKNAVDAAFKEISSHEKLKFFLERFIDNARLDEGFGLSEKPWSDSKIKIGLATCYKNAFGFYHMSSLNGTDFPDINNMEHVVDILKCQVEFSFDELLQASGLNTEQLEQVLISLHKSEHLHYVQAELCAKEK